MREEEGGEESERKERAVEVMFREERGGVTPVEVESTWSSEKSEESERGVEVKVREESEVERKIFPLERKR